MQSISPKYSPNPNPPSNPRLHLYELDTRPLWPPPFHQTAHTALSLLPSMHHPSIFRYHFPADQRMALGSHLLKHHSISLLTSPSNPTPTPFSSIHLITTQHGKPIHLPVPPCELLQVSFNTTHQAGLVLLIAVASTTTTNTTSSTSCSNPNLSVGIDLVNTRERNDLSTIQRDPTGGFRAWVEMYREVFRDEDLEAVVERACSAGLEEGVRAFYTLWALVEAFGKWEGRGLVGLEDGVKVGFEGWRAPRRGGGDGWGEVVAGIRAVRKGVGVESVEMEVRGRGQEWICAIAVGEGRGEGDGKGEGEGGCRKRRWLEGVEFEVVRWEDVGKRVG